MSEWKAMRFWAEARVLEMDNGYAVHLDDRPVRTPAKASLVVPTRPLAQEIAAEWDRQEGELDPSAMPLTRAANATLDKVMPQHAEVAAMIADYGDSDLTCYRADRPDSLVSRQADAWDPLLDWAEDELGARLKPVAGVMHHPQDPAALQSLSRRVHAMDAWRLTGLHDLVALSGSLIIGLAATMDLYPPERLWQISRVDESWQEEQWGIDHEAREQAARKENDFLNAKRFLDLSRATR